MRVYISPSGVPIPQGDIDGNLLGKRTDEVGKINKPIEDEPHQDPIHNESRSRSLQSELRLTGNLQQSQLQSQVGVLGKSSSGPQVKELQNQLNEWRAAHGKPPIGADGVFGKETEAAVKDFQQTTGLKEDGLAGPHVKARLGSELTLSKDPNFQKLSPESQQYAVKKLMERPQDPVHAANVKNAMQDTLAMESEPSFQNLAVENQKGLRYTMFELPGADARSTLSELAKDEKFVSLNPNQQGRMIGITLANAREEGGEAVPAFLKLYLNSKSAASSDDTFVNTMIDTAQDIAPDAFKMWEFNEMLDDPQFANAPREDQLAMMNGFRGKTGLPK